MKITQKQRFLNAIRKQQELNDRPPIWFMRQAGRYLPEYQEIRQNKTFEQLIQNPEIATEITLQPIKRFDLDAAIIFTDILTPLYGLNIGLTIKPGVGPIIEKTVQKPEDVEKLEITTPEEHYPYLIEEIKQTRNKLEQHALIGFSGAPFTIASYLIEGKSTRDASKTKAFAWKYPKAYKQLLEKTTQILINKLLVQIENGVDAIQIFDSWALYLSQKQYEELAMPYVQKILHHPQIKDIPKIYYSRGTAHLINKIKRLGADVLSIDNTMTISEVLKTTDNQKAIQGNLDPAVLLSTPKITRYETLKVLNEGENAPGYIFNLSKGIIKDTPIENVEAMVKTVKKFKEA